MLKARTVRVGSRLAPRWRVQSLSTGLGICRRASSREAAPRTRRPKTVSVALPIDTGVVGSRLDQRTSDVEISLGSERRTERLRLIVHPLKSSVGEMPTSMHVLAYPLFAVPPTSRRRHHTCPLTAISPRERPICRCRHDGFHVEDSRIYAESRCFPTAAAIPLHAAPLDITPVQP
ncbi:hypothetical protein LZ30DRAFT_44800 [Colletotrichum cereale]|nr:hypothetical protein LZ30DRAFT_44800 [Colletotrichum cereale]